VTDGTTQADADIDFETKATGPAVSVLGIWPIGEHFSVFGRLGLSFMNADGTARVSAEGQTQRASQSSQKTDALYGIGLEYGIGKYWGVRLGWDRYLDVGTEDVSGSIDADVITLGVRLSGGWFR
jgi:opacity protein-like surface antigen